MGNNHNLSVVSSHSARQSTDHSTIFDDVFRTIAQKMPQLLIPLINEVFQTHYNEDEHSQDYTVNSIFEKRLLILLPYHILRYEHFLKHHRNNTEKLQQLLDDFREINQKLATACQTEQKSELYVNMIVLIDQIADYIIPVDHSVRKGLGKIMGGQILQLESERLRAEGRCEAIQNMIKYNVPKETILQDYTLEEYENAVKKMPVKI